MYKGFKRAMESVRNPPPPEIAERFHILENLLRFQESVVSKRPRGPGLGPGPGFRAPTLKNMSSLGPGPRDPSPDSEERWMLQITHAIGFRGHEGTRKSSCRTTQPSEPPSSARTSSPVAIGKR